MAKVVSTNVVTCPGCGVQAIVRVWSCGCQGVTAPPHKDGCPYRYKGYFEKFKRACPFFDIHSPEMSNPINHPTK